MRSTIHREHRQKQASATNAPHNPALCIIRVMRCKPHNVEFGAAWKKTSNEGRDYLSVKLDDPSFPAPIYATLIEVEGEEGLSLIWSRSNRD